ncbi:MAG: hypothetical protein Q7S26_02845 [bacterium]|nr:hypothetical protein [bacterium]
MHGVFKKGFPCVEIEILGSGETVRKVEVIVDTGFNGYLTLPYEEAFPVGLTLDGIGSGKVADGNFSPYLSCTGTVLCGGERVRVSIDVQPNSRALLGTALLKDLGFALTVDPTKETVELLEIR